jgi:hypothetical protein
VVQRVSIEATSTRGEPEMKHLDTLVTILVIVLLVVLIFRVADF